MSGADIHIPPPLTCGACGALVDERQAWHRWPHRMPDCGGDYLVMLPLPDTTVYVEIAIFDGLQQVWSIPGDPFADDGCVPLAWRPLPPLPEWIT